MRSMHFIDEAKIYLKAGDGGPGALSFRREKFIEYGGPDGGNGGRGADIIFQAVADLNMLIDFRYKQHFRAENGRSGAGAKRTGHSGENMVIEVPLGTQVFDESGTALLFDFVAPGQEFVVAKGGDGGRGNYNFKSSVNRAPRRTTLGQKGDELWVWLKLKLLSDVGLLGLPNAGKSTFLSAVSGATPKIGDYPFTTLSPHLGVVCVDHEEVVIADLPGLIEGASEGRGLGHKFLKHLERCKILLHLIDASASDVVHSYQKIRGELQNYKEELASKLEIIALNKVDLLTNVELEEKAEALASYTSSKIIPCSGLGRIGLGEIVQLLIQNAKAK